MREPEVLLPRGRHRGKQAKFIFICVAVLCMCSVVFKISKTPQRESTVTPATNTEPEVQHKNAIHKPLEDSVIINHKETPPPPPPEPAENDDIPENGSLQEAEEQNDPEPEPTQSEPFQPDEDYSDIVLPKTNRVAHLSDNFSKWEIPEYTQKGLYKAVLGAPVNPKTNRHCIMFSVVNQGMIDFARNMYCSMRFVGIEKHKHVMVALDDASYKAMKEIDAQVVYLESNFSRAAVTRRRIMGYCDLLKMKPTILHQFLLWETEVIVVDVDIVFLENPLSVFNDEADFEVQCDSAVYAHIPTEVRPIPWQVNLGFFKVRPTSVVKKFFILWLEKLYTSPKISTQSGMRKVLKPYPTKWANNDTMIVETKMLFKRSQTKYWNMSFRYLDPMYICNAGGVFSDGKKTWKQEALRRNISRPWLIHFFHIGSNGIKKRMMISKRLWCITEDGKCHREQERTLKNWQLW